MKYLSFLVFVLFINQVLAQESLKILPSTLVSGEVYSPAKYSFNFDLSKITDGAKLIMVRTNNISFHKTYFINKNGEALSHGFRPATMFSPNDNLIVVGGQNTQHRDSFNPYGANDMTSMIILSTVNNFISRIKIGKR